METLFALLFLLAFAVMVVGLLYPPAVMRWGFQKSRTAVLKLYGGASLAFFVLFAITDSSAPLPDTAVSSEPAAQALVSTAASAAEPATSPAEQNAYTDEEYQMYREMIAAPGSESEEEALARLGQKYGKSPAEVKGAVERVMVGLYSRGPAQDQSIEQQIRQKVGAIAPVKSLILAGDFANISYSESFAAWDDAHVRDRVLERMPSVLEAAFAVQPIERVRLIAYYPTADGAAAKVATLNVDRTEFVPGKPASEYPDLTLAGPAAAAR